MRGIAAGSVLLSLFLATATASADEAVDFANNWHQWRGPNANGVAENATPPLQWSEEKNVKWKIPVPGRGSGSPIVWQDRVFVVTAIPTERQAEGAPAVPQVNAAQQSQRGRERRGGGGGGTPTNYHQFAVICLDRNSGQQVWQTVACEAVPHEPGHQTNTFASGSPCTDGKHLYVSFGSFGIFCLDMDGNIKWQRDLGDMQTRNQFGEGSSPALHGDTLVVTFDHEGQSFIEALDAHSGQTRWKVDRDEPTTWATPLIIEHQGQVQVITNGTNRVRSYDLASGQLIWECGGQAANPIPSPVAREGVVFAMTGYRGYAVFAIPLSARGDITGTDQVVWSRSDIGPYVSSPVLYKGQLYLTKSRDGILASVDAKTGQSIIAESRLPEITSMYASLVAANDHIYVTGREGTTVVLSHGPELNVVATNRLGEGIDASPALVGDQVFLRGAKHLYCIQQAP